MTFQRSPNNRTLKFTEVADATAVNVAEVRGRVGGGEKSELVSEGRMEGNEVARWGGDRKGEEMEHGREKDEWMKDGVKRSGR